MGVCLQDPIPCANGTYRDTTGAEKATDCIDCALGQYCASEGLVNPTGPCQPGFFCLRGNKEPTPTGKSTNKCVCLSLIIYFLSLIIVFYLLSLIIAFR